MKNCLRYFTIFMAFFYTSCSPPSAPSAPSTSYNSSQSCTSSGAANSPTVNSRPLTISGSDVNAVSITVGCGYVNQPCVSVTICSPGTGGTANCQTIPNLLLDTGSFGLRIFDNVVNTTNLTAVSSLYECVSYGDGSYQWGRVMKADVTLGSQVAQNVSIDIVEHSPTTQTPNVPSSCVNQQGFAGTPDAQFAGYNGILGVGLLAQDCGSTCTTLANNTVYYSCTGNTCSGSTASLSNQVTNPVSMMPSGYNNGVAIQLNNVSAAGASSSTGYMVLGIGTVANNTPPSGVVTYQASGSLTFDTKYGTQSYTTAFIDSGSNGLFFPNGCLAINASGWFAPTSEAGFTATVSSSSGGNPTSVLFNVANVSSGANMVYNNLAADGSGEFDWGLPFFLGRTVYVGIQSKSSTLGTGPYWAF